MTISLANIIKKLSALLAFSAIFTSFTSASNQPENPEWKPKFHIEAKPGKIPQPDQQRPAAREEWGQSLGAAQYQQWQPTPAPETENGEEFPTQPQTNI